MKYLEIAKHYEACLEKHGATARGMDWPNERDLKTRFKVMLGILETSEDVPTLLDLGCGAGLLFEYLKRHGYKAAYTGMDISPKMIDAARNESPDGMWYIRDVLEFPLPSKSFDYVIMNGLLTEKVSLSQEEMIKFAQDIILSAYRTCNKGIAFNIMSKHVDWEKDNLFHWGFDEMADFLTKNVSRHFVIRADYNLYEYTCYVYREPTK